MLKASLGVLARISLALGLVLLVIAALAHFGGASTSKAKVKTIYSPSAVPTQSVQPKAPANENALRADVVVLSARNTITFRGEVTPEKVAAVQLKLMAMSNNLSDDEVIYLVLDTPGGSVDAGNQLIDTVNSLPQDVKTITLFAASMGFHFSQAMGERLILPSGVMMSHRARGGLRGEVPGEMLTRLTALLRMLNRMDALAADRMGMELADYQRMIADEYWTEGADAVREQAADRIVLARCDDSLNGNVDEYMGEIFGMRVYAVMSACPVVSAVLGVKVGRGATPEAETQAKSYVQSYFADRKGFLRAKLRTEQ